MKILFQMFALLLFLIIYTGCAARGQNVGNSMSSRQAGTIEEAVHKTMTCYPDCRDIQIRGQRRWHNGQIVLYSAIIPGDSGRPEPLPVTGYAFVEPFQGFWLAGTGSSFNGGIPKSPFIELSSTGGRGTGPQSSFAIIFGEVLKPDITTIEIHFANGTVESDRPTNNVFAVITNGSAKACTLHTLDAQGHSLYERNLDPLGQYCSR